MSKTNNNLSAEQAIVAARQFLTQPGRLSGWLDVKSSDMSIKKLELVEGVMIEDGYYSQVCEDSIVNIKVDKQEVTAWDMTFSVRRFRGRLTVQVFSTNDKQGTNNDALVHILDNGAIPGFLYSKGAALE